MKINKFRWASSLSKSELKEVFAGDFGLFYFPKKDDFKIVKGVKN